ncbi:hypothetical protein SLA2020_420910 [Shorea laevis]
MGQAGGLGLIRVLFDQSTVEVITQIPIGSINTIDRSTWQHTAQGEFTVKSAYHLQKAIIANYEGENSRSNQSRDLWRHLWKLKIPHAAKVFMWRACSNALATKANLFRRKITEDPLCVQIKRKQLITYCGVAQRLRQMWSTCRSTIQKQSFEHEDVLVILSDIIRVLNQDDLEWVAVVARAVWFG